MYILCNVCVALCNLVLYFNVSISRGDHLSHVVSFSVIIAVLFSFPSGSLCSSIFLAFLHKQSPQIPEIHTNTQNCVNLHLCRIFRQYILPLLLLLRPDHFWPKHSFIIKTQFFLPWLTYSALCSLCYGFTYRLPASWWWFLLSFPPVLGFFAQFWQLGFRQSFS